MAKGASLARLTTTCAVSSRLADSEYACWAVIKHQGKGKRIDDIIMEKPSEDDLYHFREASGELENFCPDHPLNTDSYKKKLQNKDVVTSFCFFTNQF